LPNFEFSLPEIPDRLDDTSIFMTMGVFHKWGIKYYSERMAEENLRFNNLYLRIMHEIYPEMDEFATIKLEIIEDE